jgi:hypothetical protein
MQWDHITIALAALKKLVQADGAATSVRQS